MLVLIAKCIDHIIVIHRLICGHKVSQMKIKVTQCLLLFCTARIFFFFKIDLQLSVTAEHFVDKCLLKSLDFLIHVELSGLLFFQHLQRFPHDKKLFIQLFELSRSFRSLPFDCIFRCQHFLLDELRTVHFPCTVHQIMSFVDKENVFSSRSFSKEPAQMSVRIERIIVIAQNRIAPRRGIQPELKRTHLPLLRLRTNAVSVEKVGIFKILKHRIIDSVKMPSRIRTVIRVAGRLI